MNKSLRFRPEVSDDIAEASRWYDDREDGLGNQFLGEVHATLDRITHNPHTYAAGYRETRSARLHRFPYVVNYRIIEGTIHIIAVIRGSRHESSWQARVDPE